MFKHYFRDRIEKENIPEFAAIRPFLHEPKAKAPSVGELRTSLLFYSFFSSLVVLILTASFMFNSPFPKSIANRYRESNFEPFAKEKLIEVENYLSKIRNHKQGEH